MIPTMDEEKEQGGEESRLNRLIAVLDSNRSYQAIVEAKQEKTNAVLREVKEGQVGERFISRVWWQKLSKALFWS